MSTMRYVAIKRADTPEIKEMVRQFCEESGADNFQYESLIKKLATLNVFGAINGKLQGIAGYSTIGDKAIGELLYVNQAQRSKSIGGRLYHMARNHAKQAGLKSAVIFTFPHTAKRYLKLRGNYKVKFTVLEGDL
jgi:N-acetylglutamate synthase-like GNAT family acetyltransferase